MRNIFISGFEYTAINSVSINSILFGLQGPSPNNFLGASLLLNQPTQSGSFIYVYGLGFLLGLLRQQSSLRLSEGGSGSCVLKRAIPFGCIARAGYFSIGKDSDYI